MIKYTIRRMIYVLPTLWAVVTFVFFLIRIVPGGPAVAALGIVCHCRIDSGTRKTDGPRQTDSCPIWELPQGSLSGEI